MTGKRLAKLENSETPLSNAEFSAVVVPEPNPVLSLARINGAKASVTTNSTIVMARFGEKLS